MSAHVKSQVTNSGGSAGPWRMMRRRHDLLRVATKQPKVEAVIEIHFVTSHYPNNVQETHPPSSGALPPGVGGRDARGLASGGIVA